MEWTFSRGFDSEITARAMSDFDMLTAEGMNDGSIRIINNKDGKCKELCWHRYYVNALDFAIYEDVPILASAGADKCVAFWEPRNGEWKVVKKDITYDCEVMSVCFSASGKNVAIGLYDGTVEVREVGLEYDVLQTLKFDSPVRVGYTSEDYLVVVDAANIIHIYNGQTQLSSQATCEGEMIDMKISRSNAIALLGEDGFINIAQIRDGKVDEISSFETGNLKPQMLLWDSITESLHVYTSDRRNPLKYMQCGEDLWKLL